MCLRFACGLSLIGLVLGSAAEAIVQSPRRRRRQPTGRNEFLNDGLREKGIDWTLGPDGKIVYCTRHSFTKSPPPYPSPRKAGGG